MIQRIPIKQELKTRRTTIVLQPSIYSQAKLLADSQRQSFNDLIHMLLEEYLQKHTHSLK